MSQPWSGPPAQPQQPNAPGQWNAPPPAAAVQPYSPAYPQPGYPPAMAPMYQPPMTGVRLVTPGGRFGALLLDVLLSFVTLGIGWMIWSLITWSTGQTPAKRLLGHVVVDANTGQTFDWGRMFLREFVIRGLLGSLLGFVTAGIYGLVDAFMVFGDGQRTLHDKMAGSVVRYVNL